MSEKMVAILCLNGSERRKAWRECFDGHRHVDMKYNMSRQWVTCREGDITTTYQCYSCDLIALAGCQIDEVRLYGNVAQHRNFEAVMEHLRNSVTKIGEF